MHNKIKMGDKTAGQLDTLKTLSQLFSVKTVWDFECFDKNGNIKWQELNRPNMIVTEGLNSLLDVYLDAGTQIAAWYVIPIETNTAPALTMTYAVPVFTECTAYTESDRQAYDPAAASGGVMTNVASKAVFSINDTKIIYGAALVGGGTDADVKGDVAGGGTLFCYSKFSAGKGVESGDTFRITISVTIANTGS
jgi:hypothetical protein